MSVFANPGSIPVQPDLTKMVESVVGAVAGGTPATYKPSTAVDSIVVQHAGVDPDIALVVTLTQNTAEGISIAGDRTQLVRAGGSVGITFDDNPGNADAVTDIEIKAVSLASIVASAVPTLSSTLPDATAADIAGYVINTSES